MVVTVSDHTAIELIAAERERQITGERWTISHDDSHGAGQLALAAAVYAIPPKKRGDRVLGMLWPWSDRWYKPTPDDRIRELVKAGALIVAEIDRIQRIGAS